MVSLSSVVPGEQCTRVNEKHALVPSKPLRKQFVDSFCESGVPTLENTEAWRRRHALLDHLLDSLPDQLGFALASLFGSALERSLQIIREIDGGLLHTIRSTIRGACEPLERVEPGEIAQRSP